MNICYDGAFPEAARVMALEGADSIVLPTNWPPGPHVTAELRHRGPAHTGTPAYCGGQSGWAWNGAFRSSGRARLAIRAARVIASAEPPTEAIFYADLDLQRARNKHIIRVPGKHRNQSLRRSPPPFYGRVLAPVTVRRPPIG
jgi:predicted amidohydrolase